LVEHEPSEDGESSEKAGDVLFREAPGIKHQLIKDKQPVSSGLNL
jgi:hypothetical protein